MSLPRLFALESASREKFVYFVEDEGDTHALLRASGETIISPYAKFEVERAKSDSRYVNIRSCYNNRYWVRSIRREEFWIACDANEPQEDTSLRTCTLFELVFTTANNRNFARLRFAFDGRYVSLVHPNGRTEHCLSTSNIETDQGLFAVSDWELLFILPKYVAFKSNNEKFLAARTIQGHSFLQFISDDIRDPTVGDEVIPLRDGAIRVKSNHFDKFWRHYEWWISPDLDDTAANNIDTVFWPNRVSHNVVALRNMGNDKFCKRLSLKDLPDILSADVTTIDDFTPIEFHEPVLLRHISDVSFHFMDARIYGQTEVFLGTRDATNSSMETIPVLLNFLYIETESKCFNSSASLKLGVRATIKTAIPAVASDQITATTIFTGLVEWGATSESRRTVEKEYPVLVPPMTAVKVTLWATRGRCDVPFSYTQQDTLMNGHVITTIMNDGAYTGENLFNFAFETDVEPLSELAEASPS